MIIDNNCNTKLNLIHSLGELLNPYRKGGKIELKKQNNGAWCKTQTSSISNLPPKVTTTSTNLSHGEFSGKGM